MTKRYSIEKFVGFIIYRTALAMKVSPATDLEGAEASILPRSNMGF